MRNIVAGTKYLEHVGSMRIDNESTGMRCEIELQEAGMWGKANVVNATVLSQKGKVEAKIEGKWHESIAKVVSRNQLQVLWRANDLPPQAQDYYGFTYFTMTLNEITDDLLVTDEGNKTVGYKIPATDSRFRPDQRALEEGRVDEADEIKMRVEEKQRARRRAGKEVKPRWFKKVGDEDTAWAYAGGYWEARGNCQWGQQEPLW
jgi:oxysterol-binding protein-related protein 3/6/7